MSISPVVGEEESEVQSTKRFEFKLNSGPDDLVVDVGPHVQVTSHHKLIIDVDAANEGHASDIARRMADALMGGLTLSIPGVPYRAELKRIYRRGFDGSFGNSSSSNFIVYSPPRNLQLEDVRHGMIIYDKLRQEHVARRSYHHLSIAWRLHKLISSLPVELPTLQQYTLCVEAIVNKIAGSIKDSSADAIRLKEREFAAGFAEELPKRANKPSAIRSASSSLREIGLENTIPRIAATAKKLCVGEVEESLAKDLYRLRSKALSHPGDVDKDALHKWLYGNDAADPGQADRVARAFLKAYCERRAS